MLRILIVCAVIAAAGCEKAKTPVADANQNAGAPNPRPTASEKSVRFADRTWRYVGPIGDPSRPYNSSFEYSTGKAGVRLIEGVPTPAFEKTARALRMLHVQGFVGGQWIDDGPSASWDKDGSRMEGNKRLGKFDGMQRGWWPNGQLHVERLYSNNERWVDGKGWWPNGNKQWESVVIDGEEISGRTWTEDGRTFN